MPLKKILTMRDLVAYGLGGTIGAGIFVSIGVGATQAGPAVFVSFLLASVACSISGLCFCEMASRVPTSGSSYSYTLSVFGRFPAFVVGSVLVVDSIISAAACARAWSSYMCIVFPFLPHNISLSGWEHIFSFSILSGIVCVCLGVVLAVGIKETTTFNNISTILNSIVLAVFVLAGLPMMDAANWTPFAPNGFEGIVRGGGRIFFAFLGFDVVNCLAEETEDGQSKSLVPRAILWTIGLTTIVYVLVAVAFVGLAPISEIDLSSPLSSAFSYRQMSSLAYLVGVGAVGNTLTSVLSNFLIQPRIVIRMAGDGLIPEKFAAVDDNGVPRLALYVTVGLSTLTAMFVDFETLADMVSVASLVALSIVCLCVVVSRAQTHLSNNSLGPSLSAYIASCVGFSLSLLYGGPVALTLSLTGIMGLFLAGMTAHSLRWEREEDNSTMFRVPLAPIVPLLGVLANTYLLLGLPFLALIRAAIVVVCCSIYYWWRLKESPPSESVCAMRRISIVGKTYDSLETSS
jgi:APA family basic amino acid/polyamine antiporter